MQKFLALFHARNMEFVRDRGTFFWNILFPVILVFGFAFAFSGEQDTLFSIGILGEGEPPTAIAELPGAEILRYNGDGTESREAVLNRLRQHQIDMVVDIESSEFYLNREAQTAPILRQLIAGGGSSHGLTEQEVSGEPIRFVDWVVPGVIGMNMMFSCLFGVGFVLVRYRKNGVLKRIKATPVSAFTFISAQTASRLVIVVATSAFVYAGTDAFLNFTMNGSYLALLLITALAIICMIAVGLLFAGRLKSEELAGGLMNLVTFPMIILSGVFFSLEGTPELLQTIAQFLPLTHFVDGARSIMLDGAGMMDVLPNMAALAAMALTFLTISALLFRWE
ncbi:MAG: ABC transporter permease [Spirochaetales bacterium]